MDIRRVEASRNACCPIFKHNEHWKPNAFSRGNFIQKGFQNFGKILTKKPMKVIIILLTAILTGFGIWGNVLLRQKFDPSWFLPPETYLAQWFKVNAKYFPFGGGKNRLRPYFSTNPNFKTPLKNPTSYLV